VTRPVVARARERKARGRAGPPVIAVSVGCPSGVGPEVAVAAAARAGDVRVLLVGDAEVVRRAARVRRVSEKRLCTVAHPDEIAALPRGAIGVWGPSCALDVPPPFGAPTPAAGRAELAWIDEATDLVRAGTAAALVTGPVSKLAIATSGAPDSAGFRGHTEHLADRLGAREVVMAFRSEQITTALVTTHLPLALVSGAITEVAVATSAFWLADLLLKLGVARPRLAVAALNPHAGEGGLLGDEEATRIVPGIARARARLSRSKRPAEIVGPIGAESAFRQAARGAFDGVLAMYHDQATIPCKLLGFGEAVNVTLGLPIVRTSVDHGTAYDIAGTGRADARGMREAIALAVRLVER
jgi:4-hydroxythreonine-4-phosphate dehydrogenase